ncbi:hypothetical protein GGTG_00962 [Gaeumannomyces tritici R3-111a-1]|uniref:Histone deacetylase interacting domain-containing protein n=1 Tax=Gaeumannomyces tritici (strain R3-111a-1) TaxID=644352 RepID=J3NI79_GAET3|nr:hypothetical protein GGTG_00962 [Gaeumannomyces tritici R3-111a-1]EJT80972.1 hypothetical protein GGTG_00962 [Gaeumannomyces tritici R3-111a-1]
MNPQPPHGSGFDRERDRDHRDRDAEEQRLRPLHQDDAPHHERDRELSDRQQRDRESYQPGPPHHSSAGSLPIHQPVASRISGVIHSPGGILGAHNGAPSSNIGLGPPSGAQGSGFAGPLHGEAGRQVPQHSGSNPAGQQHQMFAPIPPAQAPSGGPGVAAGSPGGGVFGGPLQPENSRAPGQAQFSQAAHANSSTSGGIAQGQQPILNDALSYLDQVKVQFHEKLDVYNMFLDIMKDFKCQSIDTPGVISRVSELFAGHPNLIQGFNTFLPPGYRIECGLENNPNSIRVTTPSGSTIHSIGTGKATQQHQQQQPPQQPQVDGTTGPHGPASAYVGHAQRPGNWQPLVHHSIESPEAQFSAPTQPGPGAFSQSTAPAGQFDGHSPAHQQRVVSQGQQPAPAVPGPSSVPTQMARNAQTPTPAAQQSGLNGAAGQQAGTRGPVEFNHAISYVNKIKNRFQDKPEIYKQFLEILQTYQREQKPIQDVYAQVTTLFHTAPDLLEDFKQFLPESAAQARTVAGQRHADDGTLLNHLTQIPPPSHSARDGPKMPPVGNFAVPVSASKENKKRPRPEKQQVSATTPQAQPSPAAATLSAVGAMNKRAKVSHKPAVEAPSIEPSLTPIAPEPLAPEPPSSVTQDKALANLDRIKKHIGNRTTLHEFLKLINLFTQGLIDKNVLVHKAQLIIGGNVELMTWFKDFVRYTGDDELVENKPEPPSGRVSLSNCRGYGPSYRLLPKRERLKPCSGRDELCNSVLNDEWASHPTWASEDSGFVAHRKNAFEEGLHRIEEERHDYDFFIEANQKCIQLLEPIAQQMLTLSPAERQNFRMPPGLGGQSTSIYKRVLKKVYGSEKGAEVVNDMFQHPFTVVPIVMARLKQKDEEWRFSQREWEKVWQSQTKTMHLKSLDHQGIQVKSNDKRNFSAKHLVDLIKTKHEEQKRLRINKGKAPRYQYLWSFADQGVLLDLIRFMVLYAMNSGQHGASEKDRILEFFETSIPQFFGIHPDQVRQHLIDIDRDAGEEEADDSAPAELSNGRSRRNGKKSDLLRGLLDPGRNGSKTRSHNEDSAASASKETTPDVGSANEEDAADAPEDGAGADIANDRWLPTVPGPVVVSGKNPVPGLDAELKADCFFPRPWYNFFCNQTIFVFFSVFQTLYQRLKQVKESKNSVLEEIRREKADKPAQQLGLVHDEMNYFEDNSDTFWPRTVELIEDYITGEIDESKYQDVLRHYYLKSGWTLYTIQDLLKTLCRQALVCNNSDSKEKTPDLVHQFLVARSQEETSYQTEISARKFAEKCIKDGEMFLITWAPTSNEASVRWLQKDDTTFHVDEMEPAERWKYYISSYMRVESTEGVPRSRLQKSLLTRNLPSNDADSDDGQMPKPIAFHEGLTLRICLNSSKIVYEKNTSEYFVYNTMPSAEDERAKRQERAAFDAERRAQLFREKMIMNNAWMKDMSQDEVQGINEDFQKWAKDGALPSGANGGEADVPMAA